MNPRCTPPLPILGAKAPCRGKENIMNLYTKKSNFVKKLVNWLVFIVSALIASAYWLSPVFATAPSDFQALWYNIIGIVSSGFTVVYGIKAILP